MLVTVRSVAKRPTRNRRTMVTAQVGDGSGRMSAVFFNQPWRERQLQPGMTVALFGRADTYRGSLQMTNPVVDLIGDRTGRIVPIYPQSEKADLNTWEIAGWVESALERCTARGIADPVPAAVLERLAPHRPPAGAVRHPRARRRWRRRRRPAAAWPSTSCCGCSSCWSCASRRWSARPRASATTLSGALVARFHAAAALRADGDQRAVIARDRGRPGRPAPDAPAAPGRRRVGQDGGRGQRAPHRRAGWPPRRVHGAHRGAGRAARGHRRRPPGRRDRAGAREPLRRPAAEGGAAHQPRHAARSAGPRWPGWPTAPSTSSSAPTPSSRRACASTASARS